MKLTLSNATTEDSAADTKNGGSELRLYISDGGGGGIGSGAVYVEVWDDTAEDYARYPSLTFTVEDARVIDVENGALVRIAAVGCSGVNVKLTQ